MKIVDVQFELFDPDLKLLKVVKSEHSVFMREIIATTVAGDPEKYSEPFLGQSNERSS